MSPPVKRSKRPAPSAPLRDPLHPIRLPRVGVVISQGCPRRDATRAKHRGRAALWPYMLSRATCMTSESLVQRSQMWTTMRRSSGAATHHVLLPNVASSERRY
eukprot:6199338-Pleurochrysis_carterae.AAC.3